MHWHIFYNAILVPLGWLAFHIVGLFDKKATRGIRARRHLFKNLEERISALDPDAKCVWFHSSSMGEFEQAKPIISELKRRFPEIKVVVSFFSPSGFEHSQRYQHADVITYIPFDSYQNARRFVNVIRPTAAVIVRYDIWPNHLWALCRAGVPAFIANATLHPKTSRRWPIARAFHRQLYNRIEYILTVSDKDRRVFESLGVNRPVLDSIGDTRYDQVMDRSRKSRSVEVLDPQVVQDRRILVVGSSWKEDEEQLLPACKLLVKQFKDLLIVIVPHEPTIENLERIEHEVNSPSRTIRFSNLRQYKNEPFILVDSVGILMALYRYAHIAYVGGSFRQGIHSVLEPASYGIPIVFGPKHDNSQEALDLVSESGACVGWDSEELFQRFREILDDDSLQREMGKRAAAIVCRNVGATDRFLTYLEKVL